MMAFVSANSGRVPRAALAALMLVVRGSARAAVVASRPFCRTERRV